MKRFDESPPLVASQDVTVAVLKHDGSEHRRWRGRVVERDGPLIVLQAEFDVDVSHHLLGEITRGTRLIEYYWLDRWYNVFRFLRHDRSTRLYYCNINQPPVFDGRTLRYIDMDIDVIVEPDYSYEVLDLEEFEINSERYGYSDEERANAQRALDELIGMIHARQFPFLPLNTDAHINAF